MLRTLATWFFLFVGMVWPQAQAIAAHTSDQQSSAGSDARVEPGAVPLTEAVITTPGVCDSKSVGSDPCATIVTREQFENLLNGLRKAGQPLRKDQEKALAEAYADFLALAAAARKAGMEDDPQFREFIRYQNLRVLAAIYQHTLEEKYRSPSAQDIADYYGQHNRDFEEVSLRRILIPRHNLGANNKEEYEKRALQLAHDIHERVVKGEDPDDLQKEAYKTLELTIVPPETQIGKRRKATLVPEEAEEIFNLKPGEASKVETENSSYVVYRVDSKRTLPVDQVKDEIAKLLFKQRFNSAIKSITGSVRSELNPRYFPEPAR